MTEAGIVLAVLGFIFGSIQYQLRIKLGDVKEGMYRAIIPWCGDGRSMSIFSIKEHMEKALKGDIEDKQRNEYQKCINEWHDTYGKLHLFGMYLPALGLAGYMFYKFAVSSG